MVHCSTDFAAISLENALCYGTMRSMDTPLLVTKLYAPHRRPDLVSRRRLLAQLDVGLQQQCRLTLISAPAGYGKTTLVSSWISDFGWANAETSVKS